jgi:CRP-like cAMP-binding protein
MDRHPRSQPESRFLATLPAEVYDRLRPDLQRVPLAAKQSLYEPGRAIEHVYFPTSGVISLLTIIDDGTAVEVTMVGNEGLIGLPVFLGANSVPGQALVQIPGEALRMPAAAFVEAVSVLPALHDRLHRYAQATLGQIALIMGCNQVHSVDRRCARWLLMSHDRAGRDEFPLTHETIARMLFVRRATVTEVLSRLRQTGAIQYARGEMQILNRDRLEAAACTCYRHIRDDFVRLMG